LLPPILSDDVALRGPQAIADNGTILATILATIMRKRLSRRMKKQGVPNGCHA
jgi:hypothetical protein